MTEKEQTYAFAADIDKIVERYRQEFQITYAAVIGVLTIKANQLASEADEDENMAE